MAPRRKPSSPKSRAALRRLRCTHGYPPSVPVPREPYRRLCRCARNEKRRPGEKPHNLCILEKGPCGSSRFIRRAEGPERIGHRPFSLGGGNGPKCPTPAVRKIPRDQLNWVETCRSLQSQNRRALVAQPARRPETATPEQVAHGRSLVMEYGCASCHEISGIKEPENFAPELTRIGSKPVSHLIFVSGMQHTLPAYIAGKIRQPRSFAPGLKMPQYAFSTAQIAALTTALLAQDERMESLSPSLTVPSPPTSRYEPAGKAGRRLGE